MKDQDYLIDQLYSDISIISDQMHQNREKLARLKRSHQNITDKKEEFPSNKRLIDEPQLTSSVWAGKHSNKFLDIRNDIETAYFRIESHDIERLLENIEEKISYFEAVNQTLTNSISSKREIISQFRSS
ncbi:YwqH-like family protein [Cytobacillus horneckiae]|uniref:DUF5082 domain-containing protein n=1 Tax=Cytobacillus horneckiae TaxID=549687 RepID=A0A2N0ZCE0_9BACI|nr:DUF5082 family protein [Cytobacillus horneckiae]MEC1158127.1 DUF5082 family protein [Cytobacillus horneckiae]MED2936398.1 DUF5082 family protein [Cytobacillus horneckiae]PKG27168.1 DUF5082 domain-containing protein [Cytobacillus horneckiae]